METEGGSDATLKCQLPLNNIGGVSDLENLMLCGRYVKSPNSGNSCCQLSRTCQAFKFETGLKCVFLCDIFCFLGHKDPRRYQDTTELKCYDTGQRRFFYSPSIISHKPFCCNNRPCYNSNMAYKCHHYNLWLLCNMR